METVYASLKSAILYILVMKNAGCEDRVRPERVKAHLLSHDGRIRVYIREVVLHAHAY